MSPHPKPRSRPICPNSACHDGAARPHRHGLRPTRRGRLTRYKCGRCEATFTLHSGTVYHRLRLSPTRFDEVARMTVEG
jgi:transposase-like protein